MMKRNNQPRPDRLIADFKKKGTSRRYAQRKQTKQLRNSFETAPDLTLRLCCNNTDECTAFLFFLLLLRGFLQISRRESKEGGPFGY